MEVNTSGETRQSFNNSSRRWAHAGVIFSPPWHGMPIGDARWKRLIQQCVTGCNWGQKRRDSRYSQNCSVPHYRDTTKFRVFTGKAGEAVGGALDVPPAQT